MTFYELEKLCKKRRIKRRVFFLFFVIFIIFVIFAIWFFAKKRFYVAHKQQPKKQIIKKVKTVKKIKNVKKIVEINKTKPSIILTPVISLDFVEDINISKEKTSSNMKQKTIQKQDNNFQESKRSKNIVTTEILPSYEECIYQAEDALKNKNYSLALKWAKNANIKDKTRPEAWIISAKILYLEGKKQKAINVLKLYLQYYKNKKVEKFLRKLENEK